MKLALKYWLQSNTILKVWQQNGYNVPIIPVSELTRIAARRFLMKKEKRTLGILGEAMHA